MLYFIQQGHKYGANSKRNRKSHKKAPKWRESFDTAFSWDHVSNMEIRGHSIYFHESIIAPLHEKRKKYAVQIIVGLSVNNTGYKVLTLILLDIITA